MIIRYEKTKVLICMGIAFTIYIIGIIASVPLHTSTDELGAIAGAAMLAGRNWSGVIDFSGYYGFGYYSLFFWLFKITDSPIVIYRIVIVSAAFLRVLIIPVAFYIAKNYLKIRSEKQLLLSAFMMPFMYSTTVGMISNEYVLGLLVWIIILLVCKIIQYKEIKTKRILYAVLLILSCFYILFIHTRALTILIAVLIVIIGYAIAKREFRFNALVIAAIPIVYIVAKRIITKYQLWLYGATDGKITNATIEISGRVNLLDTKVWDIWVHMILGMMDTENILTGGFFLVCIVTFCFYLKKIFQRKFNETNIYCNIILSISILCMGATICAFLLSGWFEGMLVTWKMENAGIDNAYKGLTYVRYWNIYMPPFALSALSIMRFFDYRKILRISSATLILSHIFFIKWIIPLIKNHGAAASVFYGLVGFRIGDVVNMEFYYKCIIYSTAVFLLIFIIAHSKYKQMVFAMLIIFLVFNQTKKMFLYDADVKEHMSSKIMSSYEEKCNLEQAGVNIGEIYLIDNSTNTDANWKIYSIAQFYFNCYPLKKDLPDQIASNDVIISNSENEEIENKYQDIFCYILDDNEVWYTYLDFIQYNN